jgi:hypothetical protein
MRDTGRLPCRPAPSQLPHVSQGASTCRGPEGYRGTFSFRKGRLAGAAHCVQRERMAQGHSCVTLVALCARPVVFSGCGQLQFAAQALNRRSARVTVFHRALSSTDARRRRENQWPIGVECLTSMEMIPDGLTHTRMRLLARRFVAQHAQRGTWS